MVEVLFTATKADVGASAVRYIHGKAREMIILLWCEIPYMKCLFVGEGERSKNYGRKGWK